MLSSKLNKNGGVALLYAVLLVSIVLTISLSLLNITFKQIVLTAVSRDSQIAHFNAWSAVDCIRRTNRFFNKQDEGSIDDKDNNPFGVFKFFPDDLQPASPAWSAGPPPVYTCNANGENIEVIVDTPSGIVGGVGPFSALGIYSRYKLTGSGLIGSCAFADVVKVRSGNYAGFPDDTGDDSMSIMIEAFGYNSSHLCNGQSSPRLIERRIRMKIKAS